MDRAITSRLVPAQNPQQAGLASRVREAVYYCTYTTLYPKNVAPKRKNLSATSEVEFQLTAICSQHKKCAFFSAVALDFWRWGTCGCSNGVSICKGRPIA